MGPTSLRRLVTVNPGMCGSTRALVACVGDWTWEAVSDACALDVCNARDGQGRPTYLSFYYCRITSSGGFHPQQLTFGDHLDVQSRVFQAGRRGVLTVHRLRRTAGGEDGDAVEPFRVSEAYTRHRDDCIHVENFNLWVSRGSAHSNVGLVCSPPVGFDHAVLPPVPDTHSPRFLCDQARRQHAFPDPVTDAWPRSGPDYVVERAVDITSDVNGVGLLYFASYFAIAERAQLDRWLSLGRSRRSFLSRALRDARICYLGNADLDARLRLRLRTVHSPEEPSREKTSIVIDDVSTDRTIAVADFLYGPQELGH
ncbi:LnmK family bifunctional acyltransferase/decarboxylase [Streptomyces sp. NPDC001514]